MDDRSLAEALTDLAHRLGIEVRVEPLEAREGTRGGLCIVHGKTVLLVDEAASLADRVAVLAEALCGENVEALYLPPAVRDRLNRARRKAV